MSIILFGFLGKRRAIQNRPFLIQHSAFFIQHCRRFAAAYFARLKASATSRVKNLETPLSRMVTP